MMSSPESRLTPDHEIQLSDAASGVQSVGSESKQGPNTTTSSQAESLLAAEKRTLEMTANEQSLRLIIDSIPGFVFTTNAVGEIELVNRQILEYFGKTTEELKNWASSDAVHPDDLPRMIGAWRRASETGQPLDLEYRGRGPDGVYRWFHVRGLPQLDAEGRVVRWYNLATDIDERKRAEDALRSNEQSLRLIVDSIPGFVTTRSATGEIELLNRQVLEYFGKTTEELKNWATSDVVHSDDLPRVLAWRRAVE